MGTRGKVYLFNFGFKRSGIYFWEKSQRSKKKFFAVSELAPKITRGGEKHPPVLIELRLKIKQQ